MTTRAIVGAAAVALGAALVVPVGCEHGGNGSGAGAGNGSPLPPDERPTVYGGARPVTLQRPATLEEGRRYPLVLVLHGFGATGAQQQSYLQLTALADAFVLAPDGTPNAYGLRFWNAGACCDFGGAGVDDVAYLGGLVDAVSKDWPVDPARVIVVGHSNGAFMAYRLACERADAIAAIAGLAGAATIDGCDPGRPVSVLHVHGTADRTIAYGGGTLAFDGTSLGAYPGAVESVAAWAALDGCGDGRSAREPRDLVSALPGAETRVEGADGCPPGVGVELWTIEDGGHIPALAPGFGAAVLAWLDAHARP